MSKIKNIGLIKHLLTEDQLKDLETGATMHLQNSRIEFKILEVNKDEITIRVVQNESPSENHLSIKELVKRGKDLFKHFFPDKTIHTRAFAYSIPKADEVNPGWIQSRMQSKRISQKSIVAETEIDKVRIGEWINGLNPMSQEVKAMFWYMLR
jgi:hypothetical protein